MIKENQKLFNVMLVICDAAFCVISMVLAFFAWFHRVDVVMSGAILLDYYMRLMVAAVPAYFLIYHYMELHESFRYKSIVSEAGKIIRANIVGLVFMFVLAFFLKEVNVSRGVFTLFACFNTAFSIMFRYILRRVLRALRRKGYNLKHLVLVGWNEASDEFFKKVAKNINLGYWIDGYFSDRKVETGKKHLPWLGKISDLPELLEHSNTDEVIISLSDSEFSRIGEVIEYCEKAGIKCSLLPFYTKYLPTKPYIDEVEGMPLINIRKIPLDNFLNAFIKRAFDVVCSGLLLIVLSPFLAAVAIGVKLSSPGPVIYRQERIGLGKKPFTMYKFRSMGVQADGSDMTTWGTSEDDRRTRFGEFIRKFSIDELPQLWNVLRGDMSLVGPRPERPFFVERFREEVPLYMLKHLVRPGITGWAQVNGWRGDTSIEERIKCDIFYIENWTFLLDIKILLLTVFKGFVNKSEKISK